jgi:hypothetical protein
MFILNIVLLALYYIYIDIADKFLRPTILILISVTVITFLFTRITNKLNNIIIGANLSISSLILFFVFIEIIFRIFPNYCPLMIRNYFTTEDRSKIRYTMVDFLGESPYVKFKPNTLIKSQDYRGTPKQFSYTWITDKLGFKNSKNLLDDNKFFFVAVGDSFTEGMGVDTDKTWASQLTERGFTTYNLGVQGYAPIQMEGAFKLYGKNLQPKYVVIGYCSHTYVRESCFFDIKKTVKNKLFTDGIQSIVRAEARENTSSVTTAVYLIIKYNIIVPLSYSKQYLNNPDNRLVNINIKDPKLKQYAGEIESLNKMGQLIENLKSNSKEWQCTLNAFLNIKKMADGIGAKTIIIFFPHRSEVYYEKATGYKFPENSFMELEADNLKSFCDKNNIMFINLFDALNKYTNEIDTNAPIDRYPYLEIDGHMSPIGHKIVADELLKSIYIDN